MKRSFIISAVLLLSLALCACGGKTAPVAAPSQSADVVLSEQETAVSGDDTAGATGEENTAERTVHVTTVDEFLNALDSNTVIQIDTDLLDLSAAENYGESGGGCYRWEEAYDGPALVIYGVDHLTIQGQGTDKTVIQAVPRYADVLSFLNCSNVHIGNLTAGHVREEPGSCTGDVLEFSSCENVTIEKCGLFGCGVTGIVTMGCKDFAVRLTEIYECSWAGALLTNSRNICFEQCSVHDCGMNNIILTESSSASWDEKSLEDGDNLIA